MAERAQDFRSSRETESLRTALDRECTIPLAEFAGLVGKYYFVPEDYVLCQLEHKPGEVCGQSHGNGWVAKRKDGKEGYIGGTCAQRHFGADSVFATEASRVRRELRIDDLISRLNQKLNDPAFKERAFTVRDRYDSLRSTVTSERERWPMSLILRLRDAAKGSNAIEVEYRYVEVYKDERGKERTRVTWQRVTIGHVFGAQLLDDTLLRPVGRRVRRVIKALEEARPARDQKESTMRDWLKALEDLDGCESEIDEWVSGLAAFMQPSHLHKLCWLVRHDGDQLAIVKETAKIRGVPFTSDDVARTYLNNMRAEIRKLNADRDFRVV